MTEFASYATKDITPTQAAFADWILEVVFEGKLPKGLNEESFRRAVALGGSLRSPFQKSEWWKNDPRNYLANVDARREAKAAEAVERARKADARNKERLAAAERKLAELRAAAGESEVAETA